MVVTCFTLFSASDVLLLVGRYSDAIALLAVSSTNVGILLTTASVKHVMKAHHLPPLHAPLLFPTTRAMARSQPVPGSG